MQLNLFEIVEKDEILVDVTVPLKFIMAGGDSLRYHTVRTVKSQDIAAHSFGVAWLCELLMNGEASKNLIMAALSHDLAEHVIGDIPSPSKRALGLSERFREEEMKALDSARLANYLDDLTEGEELTLQLADILDGLIFCIKERRLGNVNVSLPYERFHGYAFEVIAKVQLTEAAASYCFDPALALHIISYLGNQWKELDYEFTE